NPAGFLCQSPNAFGVLEDLAAISKLCKTEDVITAISWNPIVSGLLKPPGHVGFDIVTGEGQALGNPLFAGGPGLGLFSTRHAYRSFLPGRLVGKVLDVKGTPVYALVSENREQHVAREKATSNICSNQAHNAMRAAVYLSFVGKHGFKDVATLSTQKAHYLAGLLTKIPGVSLTFSGPFFNEFALTMPCPVQRVIKKLEKEGLFPGIRVHSGHKQESLLVAVTEKRSSEQLNDFVSALYSLITNEMEENR
ncbi:MAG: glycine cleavage system pyridoxal-binding protein P, partial [Candidatus Marinamargulisbacteria bacterium]